MDLSAYCLNDLLLTAIKSEIEARQVYVKLARNVTNFLLKDRLSFLAGEEEKHEKVLTVIFEKEFPDTQLVLPARSPVPVPQIRYDDESIPLSEVLTQAMEAERAASEFYTALIPRFPKDRSIQHMLKYIARMELGHFKLLEDEREDARDVEDADETWPMFHVGP